MKRPLPREHAAASLGVGAAFLLLYGFTAAPGLRWADSAEFQTVALLGGIPHSSGYPLWLIAARAFAWLPAFAPEFRVTLLSATAGAAALALLVRRLGELRVSLAGSVIAAGLLGLSFSFWRVALRAEVYSLSILMAFLALGALLRARATGARREVLGAGFLLGLVMTVHLFFAPAVAIAGLALAWREGRRGLSGGAGTPAGSPTRAAVGLALLLGAFLLGLTPYLLLVWMDAHGVPANFLDLVRHAASIMGVDHPPLDTPWQRVWWLVTGRNVYPPLPVEHHPRSIFYGLVDGSALLCLFELGPVAAALAALGFARRWRRDRSLAALLAAAIVATLAFAAVITRGAMLDLFLLPATALGTLLAADGVDGLLERFARSRPAGPPTARAWAGIAIWALLVFPPHLLRASAAAHPIGPRGWQVIEEDRTLHAGLFPGMRHAAEAAPWGRSVLESAPRNALLLASWPDFTPLRHLRLVEGLRPDLTLDQIAPETIDRRVRGWLAARDGLPAPIVFTERGERERPYLGAADSVKVAAGRWIYIVRAVDSRVP